MKEARYYSAFDDHVECTLCPHHCKVKEGRAGTCRVRRNVAGKLVAENYGLVCSLHADPIEKKPLYHYFPGRSILSVGSIGCNLRCRFCQNWEISQCGRDEFPSLRPVEPEAILRKAAGTPNNIGLAYTYNEPAVWFEFMLDLAILAKERQLKNVMVTNGFINREPLLELIRYVDAFSVDLKAFHEDFYRDLTSSRLGPVLDTLRTIRGAGRHLEITNLVITNRNDDPADFSRMVDWIAGELGPRTVLHISRYFPTYHLDDPPTPEWTMTEFYQLARKKLKFVYLGNIRTGDGQNTYCPACSTLAISRSGYFTELSGIDHQGACLNCGAGMIPRENITFA